MNLLNGFLNTAVIGYWYYFFCTAETDPTSEVSTIN